MRQRGVLDYGRRVGGEDGLDYALALGGEADHDRRTVLELEVKVPPLEGFGLLAGAETVFPGFDIGFEPFAGELDGELFARLLLSIGHPGILSSRVVHCSCLNIGRSQQTLDGVTRGVPFMDGFQKTARRLGVADDGIGYTF